MAGIGAWRADMAQRALVTHSPGFPVLFDLPEEHQIGMGQSIKFALPEYRAGITAAIQRCLDQGSPEIGQAEIETARGRRLWIEYRFLPATPDKAGTVFTGVMQDITQRKADRDRDTTSTAAIWSFWSPSAPVNSPP